MEYVIEKRKDDAGHIVYTVFDETGREVGQRLSRTNYVACVVKETQATSRITPIWFRSLAAIPGSRHLGNAQNKVAYWFGAFRK